MDRLLVKPIEAAHLLGLGRSKIYELLASGELPSVKIGKSVRVPMDALREWVTAHTTGSEQSSRANAEERTGAPR